ncbi:hypothetical protein HK096_008401 [Nowakowskiella sp. JEL0078]|nr:hypothetical protein HK096_008401 [Nowakowskiella sp. JEL0078]
MSKILNPSPPENHPIHNILDITDAQLAHVTANVKVGNICDQSQQFAIKLDDVLTKEECHQLIAATEELGYEQALLNVGGGRQILATDVRKSSRCIVDSPKLAAKIWERIKEFSPKVWPGYGQVIGLNERLRFLRYDPTDEFKQHYDGRYVRPGGKEASALTLQLYLNNECVGGETSMTLVGKNGFLMNEDVYVKCEPGKAVIFEHAILHEGTMVLKGRKYVIRTDIMFVLNRNQKTQV